MDTTQTLAGTLRVTYDGTQHCTASRGPHTGTLSMACPVSGGRDGAFSPANLVGSGLAGCMLFAMGMVARRDGLELSGTQVDVDVSMTSQRIEAIELRFAMPRDFSAEDRVKLERAAGRCPIKPSFHPDIPIAVRFDYPA